MNDSLTLGRVAGIRIGVNWSVLVIVGLIAYTLATNFEQEFPGVGGGVAWLVAVGTALLFLASLLAHELSHSLVARRYGGRVDSITLWLFGGVAKLTGDAPGPRAEALMAAAGPAASLVLGVLCLVLGAGLTAVGAVPVGAAAASWLGGINVTLALFNCLPGFPLDGGRLLRALLWRRWGDSVRATRAAARVGKGFGYALIGLGVVELLTVGVLNGLWLSFLGWFLISAAGGEEAAVLAPAALQGLTVADVMTPDPVVAPDWITVDDFIRSHALTHLYTAFPVRSFDGRLTGLVTLRHLTRVPASERDRVRVRDVAEPLTKVATARPEEPIADVARRMDGTTRVLVLDGDRLVGILSPADVTRLLLPAPRTVRPPVSGRPVSS